MIKCLIFDCDGTLVDSELLCNLGLEIKLRNYGVETTAHKLMEKYRGGKLDDTLRSIEHEYGISLKENFVPEYRTQVEQLFEKELAPCEGVPEFLKDNTLPVCVASNGPMKKINKALEITGLKKYFKLNIFSCYEINFWKPSPEIFLYAAKKMGFTPAECLIIEDSLTGVSAGQAANIKTLLYDPMNLHDGIEGVDRFDTMRKLKDIITTLNEGFQ